MSYMMVLKTLLSLPYKTTAACGKGFRHLLPHDYLYQRDSRIQETRRMLCKARIHIHHFYNFILVFSAPF